jgi:hypothetical protein
MADDRVIHTEQRRQEDVDPQENAIMQFYGDLFECENSLDDAAGNPNLHRFKELGMPRVAGLMIKHVVLNNAPLDKRGSIPGRKVSLEIRLYVVGYWTVELNDRCECGRCRRGHVECVWYYISDEGFMIRFDKHTVYDTDPSRTHHATYFTFMSAYNLSHYAALPGFLAHHSRMRSPTYKEYVRDENARTSQDVVVIDDDLYAILYNKTVTDFIVSEFRQGARRVAHDRWVRYRDVKEDTSDDESSDGTSSGSDTDLLEEVHQEYRSPRRS